MKERLGCEYFLKRNNNNKWISLGVELCDCSDLVEGKDIDWLDFILEFLDFLLEVINGDFVIFNDTTNDEFVNSVGNWFLFAVLFPDESVQIDEENFLEESVKVGLSFVWLNFE